MQKLTLENSGSPIAFQMQENFNKIYRFLTKSGEKDVYIIESSNGIGTQGSILSICEQMKSNMFDNFLVINIKSISEIESAKKSKNEEAIFVNIHSEYNEEQNKSVVEMLKVFGYKKIIILYNLKH